jgi:hypothetical protein
MACQQARNDLAQPVVRQAMGWAAWDPTAMLFLGWVSVGRGARTGSDGERAISVRGKPVDELIEVGSRNEKCNGDP